MTNEQDQLITLLFIKHGGFRGVIDAWLYDDDSFSEVELKAVTAWLEDELVEKPNNVKVVEDAQYPHLTAEITIDIDEKG